MIRERVRSGWSSVLAIVAVLALLYGGLTVGSPDPVDPPLAPAMPAALAATPPMGWNSWNTFGCDINEATIKRAAQALVRSGMAAAGYRYVVVDDCWFAPQRDAAGNLRANPARFPDGMRALADYVHALGLKFGIYESPNARTCAQVSGTYPGSTGSKGHERVDAEQFASWGVDYLKYDWCSSTGTIADEVRAFTVMRDALAATGRPIVYSINPNSDFPSAPGEYRPWSTIATMVRTTQDIQAIWYSGSGNNFPMGVRDIVAVNGALADRAGPGHWNDPDMMVVGVAPPAGWASLTATEQRTQFSMWAMMAAPLIAGNDPAAMSAQTSDILLNSDVIGIDQDRLGRQASMVRGGDLQVWAKPLADGGVAVALYNASGPDDATMSVDPAAVGLSALGEYRVRDLWSKAEWVATGQLSARVAKHGVVLLRLDAVR